MTAKNVIPVIVLALLAYAGLCYTKSGEILQRTAGEVERCARLGGASESRFHATIHAEGGQYLIAELPACEPGRTVEVQVRRGALFFNTVFSAEPR